MKHKKGFADGYKTYDTAEGYGNRKQWQSHFYERMTGKEAEEILGEQEETPYQILGISIRANKVEIKRAYRAKMFEWHPDYNPNRIELATNMSKKINAAYAILINL